MGRCTGCAETFCANCLVNIGGQKYCGSCKVLAVSGRPIVEEATIPSALAADAIKYALIGIICLAIILQPMAIYKAIQAKKEIAADPQLTGEGKANAALIIGILALVLWVIGIMSRVS
jgi:hypothetical protein